MSSREGPVIRGDFATTYAPVPRPDVAYVAVACSPAPVDGVVLSSQDSVVVMGIVVGIAAACWVSGFLYGRSDD